MARSLCFTPVTSVSTPSKSGGLIGNSSILKVVKLQEGLPKLNTTRFQTLETKATENSSSSNPSAKKSSILCDECDGNGIKVCGQCEGSGANLKDHFNGRFKAGGICWLCRGKKEILCGNCNGAGFIGGFMSTL
ncbi:protein BUNDLE SHEATH DEFECTIVE 2, chloroplastic-like [Amaranthus tricolor]|uniref:protein BUNDLE SHEATH DEFECTIVE 2, chloroplastic-like n=1 Tax=Amaranthus tricolor TaxID=29722 RepID=UPI0025857E01|nr:protein BUNDLE SHEATH DEFECTIVE 2, chloroplastic-like [Amaranthus tricolor]